MEELARKAAEAMEALGSCKEGTADERKEALKKAGADCGIGYDEVVSWIIDDE